MRNISEAVTISAPPEHLWGLLTDPDAVAKLCPGVTGAVLLPADEPMHTGSIMEVSLLASSDRVIAEIVEFDPGTYSVRSEITKGPHELRGNLGAKLNPVIVKRKQRPGANTGLQSSALDPTVEVKSRLIIDGALGSDRLGKLALFGFLCGFKIGLPILSGNVAELANSRNMHS